MNRREFLRRTLTGVLPALILPDVLEKEVERIIEETVHLNDTDFVTYITMQMNIYVNNPRMSAYITNIKGPDDE